VDDDRRTHYLLTCTSTTGVLDGTYRHISVKVRRAGANVRARDGYLAAPQVLGMPVLHETAAAVAALGRRPRPQEIPIQALALQFLDEKRAPLTAIVIDVPRQGVQHRVNPGESSFQTDFTIYARILDSRGEVVRQASQAYRLSGPAAQREAAERGDVLFYRQPALPLGHYTLEYAVIDTLDRKAGSGTQDLDVTTGAPSQLAASSLLIVRQADPVPAAQRDRRQPLQVDDVLISPLITGTTLHKSSTPALTFFYTAYQADRPLTATLDLTTGSTTLAHVPLTVPAPDRTGRIQHLARLPLSQVPPGSYDLRVTLTDGQTALTRVAAFVLEQ